MVNPSGLLVKMTRNVIASHFAKPRTDAVSHDDLPDVGLADDAYDEAEVAESVERLLSVLTPRQREVVWERVMGAARAPRSPSGSTRPPATWM